MKKRLGLTVLFLLLCLLPAARADFAQLNVTSAVTDGNALILAFEAAGTTQEQNLYGTLNTVYVNGLEAPIVRATARTYGFLNAPQVFTITLDISGVPRAQTYTAAATYSVLRPNAAIQIVTATLDAYDTYRQNVTDLNNQGYVVATEDGEILLAEGTYDDDWLLSSKLIETGKMLEIETLSIAFDVPMSDIQIMEGTGMRDMGDWMLRVRKAQASSLSIALIIDEIFPETMTYDQVYAACRRLSVTDAAGNKDFYTGNMTELSDPQRQADGTWLVTFTWSSQSIVSIPTQLRLAPYTYDAMMSPVEEAGKELLVGWE